MTKFKLGDEVFDIRHGKGFIEKIRQDDPWDPLECVFDCGKRDYYQKDGKATVMDNNPILMHLSEAKELGLYKEPVSIEVKVRWHKVTLESGDDMIVPIQLWDDRHGKLLFGDFTGKSGTLTFVEDEK